MALSNKTGAIVLTTGNKSEMATGYATLYGDMAGGFAVIRTSTRPSSSPVRLAQCPARRPGDPRQHLTRPPSAELQAGPVRPGFPAALRGARRHHRGLPWKTTSPREIVAQATGNRGSYRAGDAPPQRVQAPPVAAGVRVTQRGFGKDRRYPITSATATPEPSRPHPDGPAFRARMQNRFLRPPMKKSKP